MARNFIAPKILRPPPSTFHPANHLPHVFYLIPKFLRPTTTAFRRFFPLLGVFQLVLAGSKNADMMNAQNLQYVNLRNRAIQEGDMMARCFADSKSAYSAGNGAAAHDQSIAGKEHQRMKDVYNHQAAEWIFDRSSSPLFPANELIRRQRITRRSHRAASTCTACTSLSRSSSASSISTFVICLLLRAC